MEDPLEKYEAEPDPSDPDVVDLALQDVLDTGNTRNRSRSPNVEAMGKRELLNSVLRRGSVAFDDGNMLTKCPCRSNPAVCAMYPLPHPSTGDPVYVCTGPVVQKVSKKKFLGPTEEKLTCGQARYDCPYNPDRINERSPTDTVDVHSDWF